MSQSLWRRRATVVHQIKDGSRDYDLCYLENTAVTFALLCWLLIAWKQRFVVSGLPFCHGRKEVCAVEVAMLFRVELIEKLGSVTLMLLAFFRKSDLMIFFLERKSQLRHFVP